MVNLPGVRRPKGGGVGRSERAITPRLLNTDPTQPEDHRLVVGDHPELVVKRLGDLQGAEQAPAGSVSIFATRSSLLDLRY